MKISLLLLLLLPITAFSQVYKFNRQVIITYRSTNTRNVDTWLTPIEIEVTTIRVIMRRPSNGAGEPPTADTLSIRSTEKNKDYFKIKTTDERVIIIYGDELITMVLKEVDGNRVEYSFFNQKDDE